MGSPVVHWEINSENAKELQEFYGKLFDWHIQVLPEVGYGMVDTHAGGINGGIGKAQGPNRVTFYVEVDDPQATLDHVETMGGTTVVPVTTMESVTFAMFADPDGNVIGLAKSMQS